MEIFDTVSNVARGAAREIHGPLWMPASAASLLLSASVVAMMAGSARADCQPDPATAGADAVTCDSTGADNSPYSSLGGDDTVDITSGTFADSISGGADNDTMTLQGTASVNVIDGGTGNDVIDLLSGTVTLDVTGGDGTDTITLNGATVNDDILGNAGGDMINLLSGTVSDDVFGNAGADIITLNGATVGDDVFGGNDSDTITLLSGTINDDLFGEAGGDNIILFGGIVGDDIFGGSGADVISVTGTGAVGGSVFGGNGGDIISLNGSGVVAGNLEGGAGDDTFNLLNGSFGGSLFGGDGSDSALVASTYDLTTIAGNLDGGDDVSVADGFIDILNIEAGGTLDGGKLQNWETINLDPATPLTLTGTVVTSSDPGQGLFLNTGTLAITSLGITGNFTNSSLVDMTGNAATGDMLTVSNDYFGGGTLALDAALDATLASDMLVVNGDIGGVTTLAITDLGGAPTLTGTGPGNGIPLVDNSLGGDLADGDFVLPGGEIVKTPFTYTLSAESDSILYLQSGVLAQVYGYAILHEVMREEFPILRDRLGERRYLGVDSGEPKRTFEDNAGLWLRLDGRRRVVDDDDADEFTASDWQQSRGEFELGIDIPAFGGSVGLVSFGMHGVKSTADATAPASSGTAELDGYGFGANLGLTYFPGGGFYADLQGRLTAWDTDVEVDTRGLDEDTDAVSWGTSLEVGNRMKLGESTMLIPRGQVVYTDVRLDDFTDSDGVSVDSENSDSLTLKAGVTLETLFRDNGVSLFADASVSHDVLADSSVTASGMEFESGLEDTWGAVAVGMAVPMAEGTSAYAKADMSTPLGDTFTDSYGYGLEVGVRIDF